MIDGLSAVIDDDEAVLDSLRMMLDRYGFEVRTFTSAEGFLANRDRENACCVVCDVRLPDMSGLKAELQKRKSVVPVVLITGHGDIGMAVSAVKAGAHDFLEKPFSPDRFVETIKSNRQGAQKARRGPGTLAPLRDPS